MALQLLHIFLMFEGIFATSIFRVKMPSSLRVLFTAKQTFPHRHIL